MNKLAFTILLGVFLISPFTSGEELESGDKDTEAEQVRKAKAMMIAGIVVTSIGIAGELAGAGIMINGAVSAENESEGHETMSPGIDFVYGGIVMGISVVPLAVGIPLWVIGSKRKKRHSELSAIPRLYLATDVKRSSYFLGAGWSF